MCSLGQEIRINDEYDQTGSETRQITATFKKSLIGDGYWQYHGTADGSAIVSGVHIAADGRMVLKPFRVSKLPSQQKELFDAYTDHSTSLLTVIQRMCVIMEIRSMWNREDDGSAFHWYERHQGI